MGVLTDPGHRSIPKSAAAPNDEPLNEAGTAPGDRRFRPDVEGLRAVAILVVVLYHAGMPGMGGGYVGVDVFFVISGFVITGVLLRERSASGRTSLGHFYARRVRRILPAATLVIVVTVVATYAVVGVIIGNQTAIDSRWVEVFLANFHFASTGTNYLNAHRLPSPLQNFWSLAIEEQFYLVYPTFFIVVCSLPFRISRRSRLLLSLGVVVVASFVWSVIQTSSNPTVAYFSPLARAWELALGAMVALATDRLVRLPRSVAAAVTWAGLAAILYSAVMFGANTAYPGAPVAIPVLGAALVIAGGTAIPWAGAELLLRQAPFGWLGRLSYSFYLWHWPILILAADSAGKQSLPFHQNLVPLVLSLGAATLTFYVYETPIRHARLIRDRSGYTLTLGAVLVVLALLTSTLALAANEQPTSAVFYRSGRTVASNENEVLNLVKAAPHIQRLPADLTPSLVAAANDWGGPGPPCGPTLYQTSVPSRCVSGDLHATRAVALFGDSHAAMWASAFDLIGRQRGWRVADLAKPDCPAADVAIGTLTPNGHTGPPFKPCDAWRNFAIHRINQLHPDLVVITEEFDSGPGGHFYTPEQWQSGLERTIEAIHIPRNHIVILGNIPSLRVDPTTCLSRHSQDIQACSNPLPQDLISANNAEQAAARALEARYVSLTPWLCSSSCTPVIGNFEAYFDSVHLDATFTVLLSSIVANEIGIETKS